MKNSEELKKVVQDKYSEIAAQDPALNASSCCGATPSSNKVYNIMMDSYEEVSGYNSEADLGLGCGLPTQFARVNEGDTVVDLGSGAGNDCFVVRHEVGESGKVLGIDFTDAMIRKARTNAEKQGFNNVEFRQGDIEEMPVSDDFADVVVSNCVLNLVPNKSKVIQEIFRILKPGGHFSISDIVLVGKLPKPLQEDAEMYAGCVAGAIQKEVYMSYILDTGFEDVSIQKEKTIQIPDDILNKYLSNDDLVAFKNGNTGIYSITVFAQKPSSSIDNPISKVQYSTACNPNSGCC